jgi:hypothetical protein
MSIYLSRRNSELEFDMPNGEGMSWELISEASKVYTHVYT